MTVLPCWGCAVWLLLFVLTRNLILLLLLVLLFTARQQDRILGKVFVISVVRCLTAASYYCTRRPHMCVRFTRGMQRVLLLLLTVLVKSHCAEIAPVRM